MGNSTAAVGSDRIPSIDVGSLRSGNLSDLKALGQQVGRAARDTGFFTIFNHGVPQFSVDALFAMARRFFALPAEDKQRISLSKSTNFRGYVEIGYEQLDAAHPGDAKESFEIALELPPSDPRFNEPFFGPNYWPELPGFRDTLLTYQSLLRRLAIDLHRPIAVDLGVDADFFTPLVDPGLSYLRVLRYPPHPGIFDGKQFGAAPHTDYGALTLLAQEEVGGLELRTRDGEWLSVSPPPGRRLPNAVDQRYVRIDAAPGGQSRPNRPVFRSILCGSQCRRHRRRIAVATLTWRGGEVSGDQIR